MWNGKKEPMLKKIVVIGPESTGKSMLSQQLAEHYGTSWVPEYAREYLLKHGMKYSYDDLLTIAKGQIALEDSVSQLAPDNYRDGSRQLANPLLFVDTDMYVMKVWCEFVFGKCHRYILDQIVERKYDLYLLCNIDLVWIKDELREYPDLESRQRLYLMYKDIMVNQDVPWADISGNYEERLQRAIKAVDSLL
jgi:NadR type nicotinamide-nucleotide adenylyltransferase